MFHAFDLGIYALLGLAFLATFALSISFLAPVLRLEVAEPSLPRAKTAGTSMRLHLRSRLGRAHLAARWHIALLMAGTIASAMVVLLRTLVASTI